MMLLPVSSHLNMVKDSREKIEEEEESPAPSGIQTQSLSITRRVLYCCATTAARKCLVEEDCKTRLATYLIESCKNVSS